MGTAHSRRLIRMVVILPGFEVDKGSGILLEGFGTRIGFIRIIGTFRMVGEIRFGRSTLRGQRFGRRGPRTETGDPMKSEHPYQQFENTTVWAILERSLQELVSNKDVTITTHPRYVIGYLCQQLSSDGLLVAEEGES